MNSLEETGIDTNLILYKTLLEKLKKSFEGVKEIYNKKLNYLEETINTLQTDNDVYIFQFNKLNENILNQESVNSEILKRKNNLLDAVENFKMELVKFLEYYKDFIWYNRDFIIKNNKDLYNKLWEFTFARKDNSIGLTLLEYLKNYNFKDNNKSGSSTTKNPLKETMGRRTLLPIEEETSIYGHRFARKRSRKPSRRVSRKSIRRVSRKHTRKHSRKHTRKPSRKHNRKHSRKHTRKPSRKHNRKHSRKHNRKHSRKHTRKPSRKRLYKNE